MLTVISGQAGGGKTIAAFSGAVARARLGDKVVYFEDHAANLNVFCDEKQLPNTFAHVAVAAKIHKVSDLKKLISDKSDLVVFDLSSSLDTRDPSFINELDKLSRETGKELWVTVQLQRDLSGQSEEK